MNNINVIILGRSDAQELLGLFPVYGKDGCTGNIPYFQIFQTQFSRILEIYSVPIPLFNKHQDMECVQEDNYILAVKPFLT
jgi:hypothetical protein